MALKDCAGDDESRRETKLSRKRESQKLSNETESDWQETGLTEIIECRERDVLERDSPRMRKRVI